MSENYYNMEVGETSDGGFTKGTSFSELPKEFQVNTKKEYFERSNYMTILALVNGKFLCHNIVTGAFIPCNSWEDAKAIRTANVQRYSLIERAFR